MWQGSLIQHLFIFILVYFFGKTPKFSIIMHKWCYKGVPGNSYSKTSHDIIQSGDFIKNKIVNKRENQSATDILLMFKTLGTAQNNVSCCTVIQNIIQNIMIFFSYCVTYSCHLPLLRKLKKNFTDYCYIYLT